MAFAICELWQPIVCRRVQLLLEEGLGAELGQEIGARRIRSPLDAIEKTHILRSKGDHVGPLPGHRVRRHQQRSRGACREHHDGEITSTRAAGHWCLT